MKCRWNEGKQSAGRHTDRQTDRPPPVPLGPQIHRAVSSVVKSWRLLEKCELFILQVSGESVKGAFDVDDEYRRY